MQKLIHRQPLVDKRVASTNQFLDRACDQNIDYGKSINTTTHPMIVSKKKWNNVLPIRKNGDARKEIQSLFPELFEGIGCVKTTYKIELKPRGNPCSSCSKSSA